MKQKASVPYNLIVILGPTASGKTRLAAQLAYQMQTEIISADSRQVYRGMDIGTGKDYGEYIVGGKAVPYHLIDITDAGSDYHIHQFTNDFYDAFEKIRSKAMIPVLCGGSGLYIDAILNNYHFTSVPVDGYLRQGLEGKTRDELEYIFNQLPVTQYTSLADRSTAKRLVRAIEISTWLSKNDYHPRQNPEIKPLIFGLDPGREIRRERIGQRLNHRINSGMIAETEKLLQTVSPEKLIRYGLEYKFTVLYLTGKISNDEFREQLTIAIQQFAKRQMTYFRKMERDGLKISWLDSEMPVNDQAKFILKYNVEKSDIF